MPSSSLVLRSSTTLVSALTLLSAPVAAGPIEPAQVYNLDTDYSGSSFFSGWNFFADADPTHGFVTYLSQSDAQAAGLISAGNSAQMRVDSTTTLPVPASKDDYWGKNGVGRKSVRIESQKTWTHGLFIADLNHMPTSSDAGCGTWPAFWALGPDPWPSNGEVDIIEGANDQSANNAAGHTGNACKITNNGGTGELLYNNCNYNDIDPWGNAKNPTGCQVGSTSQQSYGAGFNSISGGVYATEWTSEAINIWFFPRGSVPADIDSPNPNPANWGPPFSSWGGSTCNIDNNFNNLRLVFDTTFCGDFGDATWSTGTCASRTRTTACDAYVASNPGAFADAYWDVNSVKVYQLGGSQPSSSTSAAATSTPGWGNYTASPTGHAWPTGTVSKPVDPEHTDPTRPWEDVSTPSGSDGSWDDSQSSDGADGSWDDSQSSDGADGSWDDSKASDGADGSWKDADASGSDSGKEWENSPAPADPQGSKDQWQDAEAADPETPWQNVPAPSDPQGSGHEWQDGSANGWQNVPTANNPQGAGAQWQDAPGSDPATWANTPAPADPQGDGHEWQDAAGSDGTKTIHLESAGAWGDSPAPASSDPAAAWGDAPAPSGSDPAAWSDAAAPGETAPAAWSDAAAPSETDPAAWADAAAPSETGAAAEWSDASTPSNETDPAAWSDATVAPSSAITMTVVPQETPAKPVAADEKTWADAAAPAAAATDPATPAPAGGDGDRAGKDNTVSPYTGAAASGRSSAVAFGAMAFAGLVGAFLL